MLNRRSVLAAGAMSVAGLMVKPSMSRAAAPFNQPKLPFAEDALAPHISSQTVGLHYGKHHKAYFDKLNTLVEGKPYAQMTLLEVMTTSASKPEDRKIFNNAAQAWNHVAYWDQFAPGGPVRPQGDLAKRIDSAFGSYDGFVERAVAISDDVFGTGWVWLTKDDAGKLAFVGYEDARNPVAVGRPAYIGIDVWEHAYYLDYQNRKADHIRDVLNTLVNWTVVEKRIAES